MIDNRNEKRAARDLAKDMGISYSAALRIHRERKKARLPGTELHAYLEEMIKDSE
jgi:hypothetical protein